MILVSTFEMKLYSGRGFGVDLIFEPRNLRIGLYWNISTADYGLKCLKLYFTLVPMLPVRVIIEWFPEDDNESTEPSR